MLLFTLPLLWPALLLAIADAFRMCGQCAAYAKEYFSSWAAALRADPADA
jgi:hypothetical protein